MFFQKKPDIDEVIDESMEVLHDVDKIGKKIVDNGVKPDEIADFDLVGDKFEKYTKTAFKMSKHDPNQFLTNAIQEVQNGGQFEGNSMMQGLANHLEQKQAECKGKCNYNDIMNWIIAYFMGLVQKIKQRIQYEMERYGALKNAEYQTALTSALTALTFSQQMQQKISSKKALLAELIKNRLAMIDALNPKKKSQDGWVRKLGG